MSAPSLPVEDALFEAILLAICTAAKQAEITRRTQYRRVVRMVGGTPLLYRFYASGSGLCPFCLTYNGWMIRGTLPELSGEPFVVDCLVGDPSEIADDLLLIRLAL